MRIRYSLACMLTVLWLVLISPIVAQTLPPAKAAIEQQYTQERSAGAQNPAPRDPAASYPTVQEAPFTTGIVNDGDAPFSSEAVKILNYWQGIVNGVRTFIYAGAQSAEGTDPQQGIVIVETQPDYPQEVRTDSVLTPVKAGPVRVAAVQNGILLLTSSTGSYVFTFDLNSRAFTSSVVAPPTLIPSTQVRVTTSGLAYSRASQTFNGTITITNVGTTAINGPLSIVFTSVPSGVTVTNTAGTFNGSPFLTAPATNALQPGESATVSVGFENPSNAPIHFTPVIYSGSIS